MTDRLNSQNESLDISHWTREEQIALIDYLIESGVLPKDETICKGAIGMLFGSEKFHIPGASGKKILYRKPTFKDKSPNQIDAEKYILEFTAHGVNISTGGKDDETHGIGDDTCNTVQQVLNINYPDWVIDFFGDTENPQIIQFHRYVFHPDIPNKEEVSKSEYSLFLRSLIRDSDLKIKNGEIQQKLIEQLKDYIVNFMKGVEIKGNIEWISIKNSTVKIDGVVFRIFNRDGIILRKVEQEDFGELIERKLPSGDYQRVFRLNEHRIVDELTTQLYKLLGSTEGDIVEVIEIEEIKEISCTGNNTFTCIISLIHNGEHTKIRLGKHGESVYIKEFID